MRVAINGFGRIGRLTFRNLFNNPGVEVVAINDLTSNHTLAHLLKYDSAHGSFGQEIFADEGNIYVAGKAIKTYAKRDPEQLPWKELDVDVVLECTGFFRTKETASKHLTAGAKKVIISAPAKGKGVATYVIGVNDDQIDDSALIMSNASCTTNCLSPVIKILDQNWGIESGVMSTIHAYTGDQRLVDAPHSDLRRSRAAAQNIIPTTTGAALALKLVYPEIGDKLMASALRVPVITGSLIELTCWVNKTTTKEEVNAAFKTSSEGSLKGVLEYCVDPIVSSDIKGNPHSSIFDSLLTDVKDNIINVTTWYDNEAGYSARLAELTARVG